VKASQRGFTLIELLIAVLLLVFVTAILLDGLHLVTAHLDQSTGKLDRSSQVAIVETFLRAQLADAQPLPITTEAGSVIDFTGTADRVAFVTPSSPGVAYGGLQVLTIALAGVNDASTGAMIADWRPYRDAPGETEAAAASRPILEGIKQATFAYFGSTGQNEPPDWHDSWEEMADLPLLVRVSVVFADGETMPELVVALRLATPAIGRETSDQ
jgi:general secretion pathway protein J